MEKGDTLSRSSIRDLADGKLPIRRRASNPEHEPLFGGITGANLEIPEAKIASGLSIREAYAHVFSHPIIAFSKPKYPDAHHPGPWIAAEGGGLAFDVSIEVGLNVGERPSGFDRLNTLWWVTSLLRLRTGAPLRMPVVSNVAFSLAAQENSRPTIWSLETNSNQLRLKPEDSSTISASDIDWLKKNFHQGHHAMQISKFNEGYRMFDSLIWSHDIRAAVILAWSSIETVLRPPHQGKKKALSAALATFLFDQKPERDKAFQVFSNLYETRSEATHAASIPSPESYFSVIDLARKFFSKCLENGQAPEIENLLENWRH